MVLRIIEDMKVSHPLIIGRIFGFLNSFLRNLLNFSTKKIEGADGMSIAFIRCIIGIFIAYPLIGWNKTPIWPDTEFDRNTHFIRMLIGGSGIVLLHTCVLLIPLRVVMVLISLNVPFNLIVSRLWLGKKSSWFTYVAVTLDFIGIVMVVNPDYFHQKWQGITAPEPQTPDSSSFVSEDNKISKLGVFLGVCCALSNTANRTFLSGRDLNSNVNVFIYSVAGIASSGLLNCTSSHISLPITYNNIIYGFILGASGYLFQYTLAESIRLEKNTNVLAVINSSSILLGYFTDVYFLDNPFDWISFSGCVIVFFCVVSITLQRQS